ncbi:hypothetical protein BY458DRAFT_519620 [Sporodiniella umbellata]|nr:hypothetical protein BY458DRAFT_519620 [Sporodiniella umbellata]
MIEFLPSEIVYNILSFLTYDQVYSMRGVCKKLGMVAEYHIYHQIKHSNQTIALKLDDNKHASLRLIANSYDPKNRVIEFVPESHCSVSLANGRGFTYHKLLKAHFSGWGPSTSNISIESLDPQDHALFLYHHSYNSSLEKVYELPCWNTTHKPRRYIGDRGLIISMAYQQSSPKLLQPAHTLHSLPVSSYPASSVAVSSTPCLEIQWVRVTLDWVVSGLKCTVPTTTQIYENSFIRLNQMLADQGYFKYDPFSEPVIDYIVRQQENNNSLLATGELPHTLISYIHSHTHECRTRLSRLQHMLEGSGIDAQVLWKYTFAKSFVIGNGSLLGEEDVVRRIQDAEEEWRQKKPAFLRRLVR